jgi:hypothetical protein
MIPYVHCPGSTQADLHVVIYRDDSIYRDIRMHNTQYLGRYEKSVPLEDVASVYHVAMPFGQI